MFIELVDLLRCPAPHRDSWLVARMDVVENRRIVSGALGCPVCGAEYPIEHGVVKFAAASAVAPTPADADTAMRIAAGLGLSAANNVGLLHGAWGAHAALVRALAPAQLLLLNPPVGVEAGDGISVLRCDTVPLAPAAVDAAAIDETAGDTVRRGLIRAVKNDGRVLSTRALSDSDAVTEVFAAEGMWIGEVRHAGPTVPLRRVPRSTT